MYWDKGPCRPKGHKFPTKMVGSKKRSFVVTWFNEFRWLEYIIKKTKAYCLCCYLFRDHGAGDAFTVHVFDSWSKKTSLKDYEGEFNSFHN